MPPNRISDKRTVLVLKGRQGPIPATAATLEPSKRYAPLASILGCVAPRRAGARATVPRLSGIRRPPRCGPARRRLGPPYSRHHAFASPGGGHGDRTRLRRGLPGSGQDGCGRLVHHTGAGEWSRRCCASSRRLAPKPIWSASPWSRAKKYLRTAPARSWERSGRQAIEDTILRYMPSVAGAIYIKREGEIPEKSGSRGLGKHVGGLGHRPPRMASPFLENSSTFVHELMHLYERRLRLACWHQNQGDKRLDSRKRTG